MLNDSTTLDNNLANQGIALTAQDTNHLRTAGKWGRFISITGMIFLAIGIVFVLLGLVFSGGMGLSSLASSTVGFPAGLMFFYFIFYAALLGVALYLYILLYRFSTNAILVADTGDQQAVTMAFSALAKLMTITGVVFIIYLALMALMMLGAIIGGVAAASSF